VAFELFAGKGRGYKPTVTVTTSGSIGLSKGAQRILCPPDCKFVQLLYDVERKHIGVKPCSESAEGARKLRERRGGGADIAAKPFFHWAGVDYSRSMKGTPVWDDDAAMLVISIATGDDPASAPQV